MKKKTAFVKIKNGILYEKKIIQGDRISGFMLSACGMYGSFITRLGTLEFVLKKPDSCLDWCLGRVVCV